MTKAADAFWFVLCGVRERFVTAGAYGFAGACVSIYTDICGSYRYEAWYKALEFFAVALVSYLTILLLHHKFNPLTEQPESNSKRRVIRKTLPKKMHIPRDLAIFGSFAAIQLIIIGVGQILVHATPDASHGDSASMFATLIPEIQRLRSDLTVVRKDIEHVDQKLDSVKRETSDDPRKELANLGTTWTTDSFVSALETGDTRTVQLFLAGGMTANTNHSGAAAVLYIFQPNLPDPVPMLELLIANGYDPNTTLLDTRILAHYSRLLPPQFQTPGLPPEYSAANRSFAGPALLWVVIRSSFAGATPSDRHVIQFLRQHGADTRLSRQFLQAMEPAWGDTGAYKEVRHLLE